YINSIDKSIFHILEIEGIEKYEIKRFNFSKQYDCETKKLNIILEDNQLVEVMKVVLELLEDNKIVNYSLKIATLNDIYE
ncbi:hypothetical protein IR145_08255, partial [Streptococcus danieliae]|nr:hypothetical protein [Streptococcus danieliae]